MPAESASLGRAQSLARIAGSLRRPALVAFAVFRSLAAHPLLDVLVGMLAAMIVTFGATLFWRNGSVFDAYWSVLPPLERSTSPEWAGRRNPLCTALLLVVFAWGVRLTINWAVGWPGLAHETGAIRCSTSALDAALARAAARGRSS